MMPAIAATGQLLVGPPFPLVAWPPTVAVTAANVERLTDGALLEKRASTGNGRMVSKREADREHLRVRPMARQHLIRFRDRARHRLLAEDVLAGPQCADGDGRQGLVGRRDDHGIDVGTRHEALPLLTGFAVDLLGQRLCRLWDRVRHVDDPTAALGSGGLRTNPTHAACPHDADSPSLHDLFRVPTGVG